ncbi:AGAP001323-PA [Anopheles gambiae str. PEST]|uniref:AGAP001323-PA n=1 Tax=Anopheles gambiae TaxID=7165 RepID=A0NH66_ANOGA|nr:AGAP001323-PA [Anopheles gambiae str. PEST]
MEWISSDSSSPRPTSGGDNSSGFGRPAKGSPLRIRIVIWTVNIIIQAFTDVFIVGFFLRGASTRTRGLCFETEQNNYKRQTKQTSTLAKLKPVLNRHETNPLL